MMTAYICIHSLILPLRTRSFWEKVSKDFLNINFFNNKHITESKLLWSLCLKQLRIPQACCLRSSQPPLLCRKPGCSGAETTTENNFWHLYTASSYHISQEVGGYLYAAVLTPQVSPTSPSPWFGKGSRNHFPEQPSPRASPPLPRACVEGPAPPRQTPWQSK